MAGSAEGIATGIISSCQGWASGAVSAAQSAIATLMGIDFGSMSRTTFGTVNIPAGVASVGSRPSQSSLGAAPDVIPITMPDDRPTKPSITYPPLPDLLGVVLPPPPDIDIPELNITLPAYKISDPTSFVFTVDNVDIRDDVLMKAAMDRLKANILYGGTGLSEAIENAIWEREKEREGQALEDATDKIITMWAKKGFSLPDGPLANSLATAQKDFMNRSIDRAREISIKQAELEQTNIFKSLEMAVSLVKEIADAFYKNVELGLRAQEYTAKFANEYIELQIKTYEVAVEGYKAQAQVYSEQIKANIAKVDVYKAQLEGELAKGQINEQNVKIYAEQLKAIEVQMDVYKSEIQAMTALLEAEKTKIEANKLQFDAWAKQAEVVVARYNGEVELYKADAGLASANAMSVTAALEASAKVNIASMEANNRQAEIQERAMISKAQIAMEAARGAATAAGTMAAGAMAAASARATVNYSENMSGDIV